MSSPPAYPEEVAYSYPYCLEGEKLLHSIPMLNAVLISVILYSYFFMSREAVLVKATKSILLYFCFLLSM